jgi:hypothetical protein
MPASAALAIFTSSSSFATATTDDTFQDIDVTAGYLGTAYDDSDLGVDFGDPDGLQGVVVLSGWPAGTAIADYSGDFAAIAITVPGSVDAIEFYVGDVGGSGINVSVTDNAGGTYLDMPLSSGFFGVATDSTFVTFDVSAGSGQLILGDIMIGSPTGGGGGDPSETPEAATLLLVATGLFMMGYFRRRIPGQPARRGTVSTISTGITPA